jgi:hypothetical protein
MSNPVKVAAIEAMRRGLNPIGVAIENSQSPIAAWPATLFYSLRAD